ncbi:MAG TPA: hypothetical protein VIC86_07570, partial [Acidimicrobiales bacterium]
MAAVAVASLAGVAPAAYAASSVSAVTATPSRFGAGASATYAVGFTATGGLAAGDTITLTGPSGTIFPSLTNNYKVDGSVLAVAPTVGTNTVTITTPPTFVPVIAGGSVTVSAG